MADEPTVDNLIRVMITQLQRIYDVQLAILNEMNSDTADKLIDAHSDFQIIGPPPFIEVEEDAS